VPLRACAGGQSALLTVELRNVDGRVNEVKQKEPTQ
jgi:hypothetical protein